jgi:hypothetical protein
MLMHDMEPGEPIFLPRPDGREVRVETGLQIDPRANPVTITIPDLKETDQVLIVVGGRRLSIQGGKKKSSKTRLALALPDDCRVRYTNRERKPRKERARAR